MLDLVKAGMAKQGDRDPAGNHASRRRAAAFEPDAQARRPLARGAASPLTIAAESQPYEPQRTATDAAG